MKKFLLFGFALFFFAALLPGQNAGLYIQVGRWQPEVSGDITTDVDHVINVAEDLALEDDSPTMFAAKLMGRRHAMIYTSWDLSLSDSWTLESDIPFQDVVFETGETVSSSLSAEYREIQYRFQFVATSMMNVGVVVAYQMMDASLAIRDDMDRAATLGEKIKAPAAGAGLSLSTPRSRFYGDLTVLYGTKSDYQNTLIRAEAGVDLTQKIGLFIGAQQMDLDMDFDQSDLEWSFSGIFAGAYLHL